MGKPNKALSAGILTLLVLIFLTLTPSAAHSEQRIALVIGIAEYSNIVRLKNTVNDTQLLAKKLQSLDFEVILVENPDLIELRAKVKKFAFQAETADVALVYYAGHGIEIAGANYLIPTDINAGDRAGIVASSVSLDDVLVAVDKARQLRIVILDSCRNDPFVNEGDYRADITVQDAATRRAGLAPASPERGTLVAYAAEAGQVALDGSGANSPFATALVEHLGTPDLEIGLVFRRIRDSVLKTTGNAQEPYTYGSLPGKPYFFAGDNQSVNSLKSTDRKNAWRKLGRDHETQLVKLADSGDTRALMGLAYMRLNPEQSDYDPSRAISLFDKAADAGDAEAKYELGRLYERGIGAKQDTKKALKLYEEAAELNYADAINDLGFLHYQGGLGIVRDQKRAIKYFGRAADLRHPQAMFNYAALIDDGIVPGKNLKDAGQYLYKALRSGVTEVYEQLTKNPNMFKKPTRAELQRQLAAFGLYEGAIDGQVGPGTKKGLSRAYGIKE